MTKGRCNNVALAFMLLLACATAGAQQEVAKASLGGLALQFAPAQPVAERPGSPLLLQVMPYPGDVFELRLPFHPNRIEPLVAEGATLPAGAAVARLTGPELGIWLARARATQRRFADVRRRYDDNRPLFEQGALSAARWSEIASEYLALDAQVRNIEHVLEVLRPSAESDSVALLETPVAGRVDFAQYARPEAGELLVATILADEALRLVGRIAADESQAVLAMQAGACRVAVAHVEQQAERLYRQIWSEPLVACPELAPGALLSGHLVHGFDGYRVPRAAVFRVAGQAGVAVDDGDSLRFVPVVIASEDRDSFFVRGEGEAAAALAGGEVLVRSVSAVQGLLLGIGSE
jgi:hypothetical protein